jgi:transcription antitermination protein NusB
MSTRRRQSRELALQLLFQMEFNRGPDALAAFQRAFEPALDVWEYAQALVSGVTKHAPQIDQLLQSASAHWTLTRMASVDRNVMRIAVFEMKFSSDPVPPAVAIDEAVDISRKFGTVDSGSFVNGVLDQIMKH